MPTVVVYFYITLHVTLLCLLRGDELKTSVSEERWITTLTEKETMCGLEGEGYIVAGSIRKALLTTSQSPSVSNLEAVKLLLAWSSFHP